jgi:hypothetical protein
MKENKDLLAKQREMAPADEARRVTQENMSLKKQLEETRAALLSYKSMHNVVCSQVESLKLMQERAKDEQQTQYESLQQLTASEEEDKQKVGKLLHVVMLARW